MTPKFNDTDCLTCINDLLAEFESFDPNVFDFELDQDLLGGDFEFDPSVFGDFETDVKAILGDFDAPNLALISPFQASTLYFSCTKTYP